MNDVVPLISQDIEMTTNMKTLSKTSLAGLVLILAGTLWGCAPSAALERTRSAEQVAAVEEEVAALSAAKWEWMADRNVDELAGLFHEDARFVHMSGTWGTERELEIIRSGSIHYKQADVHDVVVETFGDTAILWNRITLLAEVRGNEVSNEFTVTEVYRQAEGGDWKLLDLTFSSVRDSHELEH